MTGGGRVLLLEDDARIRRFVSMVLASLEVELIECERVLEAVRVLEQAPVDVVICDLMLAGESGFDLIELIGRNEAWRSARIIVFSAAIDGADRARIQAHGVWGQLAKPTSVAELTRCVSDALAARPSRLPAGSPPGPEVEANADSRLPTPADEAAAITRFFEGNAALFEAYREASRGQFRCDLDAGDLACADGDMAAMRRLAHSLKTAVGLLGGAGLSDRFATLEALARDGRAADVRSQWAGLRAWLQQLSRAGTREAS